MCPPNSLATCCTIQDVTPTTHGAELGIVSPELEKVDDWRGLLAQDPEAVEDVHRHTRTGRPLGSDSFLEHVETITGRALHLRSPGRKRKK